MLLWLGIGILAASLLLVTAIITVVALFQRRFHTAIRAAILAGCLIILAVVSFSMFAGKAAAKLYSTTKSFVNTEQQAMQRRQQQIDRLKAMIPPAQLAGAPANFFTYDGFWDWWRIPLIYPYSLEAIDTLDNASLNRHNSGPVEDPNNSEEQVQEVYHIISYTFDSHWLLFQRMGGKEWGLFNFATGKYRVFHSKQALLTSAKQHGYTGDMQFRTIQEGYDRYYFPDSSQIRCPEK